MHLARRLKELRQSQWPDRKLTQPELGSVFGVGAPSISSWESGKVSPPPSRLDAYATFFATHRSVEGGLRLLSVDDMTAEERSARSELASELSALARGVEKQGGVPRNLWHFPDGQPVRLICGEIERLPLRRADFLDDEEERESARSKYASGDELNYMQLMAYADVDSLVELFGHIRAQNPASNVGFDLAQRLESDDLQSHLVIVGGLGNRVGIVERLLRRAGIPIVQRVDPDNPPWGGEGEVFEVRDGARSLYRPSFDDEDQLVEDVGLFIRAPNPYNDSLTLTVVSGVFTRGVYGAARMFTDERLRERNEDRLTKLFPGSTKYVVLVRVRVEDHATITPDINVPDVVLHQWSQD
jgi:transcriptional regulator with XRE-family HTH domain